MFRDKSKEGDAMRLAKEILVKNNEAVTIGLLILLAALSPLLRFQLLTGTIVNGVLIFSVARFGVKKALIMAAVPSVFACFFGFLPQAFYPAVLFIIASNVVLIFVFYAFSRYNYWVGVGVGAFLKFVCLFGTLFFLFPKALLIASYLQIVTALLGGSIAWCVSRWLKVAKDC